MSSVVTVRPPSAFRIVTLEVTISASWFPSRSARVPTVRPSPLTIVFFPARRNSHLSPPPPAGGVGPPPDPLDRQVLWSERKWWQELNRQSTEEAAKLTRALKGDKKIQGNWGDLILERVLERSGLRKGVEYETQGSYRDEDNQLLRPDVIVHLPDQRNLVIDSKVSLVAYQQWVTADEEEARAAALKQHAEAVRHTNRTFEEKE